MTTPREQALRDLRQSIDTLPERTRQAMLSGLGNNTVITGAFSRPQRRLPDARRAPRGAGARVHELPRGVGPLHRRPRPLHHAPGDGRTRCCSLRMQLEESLAARGPTRTASPRRSPSTRRPSRPAAAAPATRAAASSSTSRAPSTSTARPPASAAAARRPSSGWTGCSRRRSCCPRTSARRRADGARGRRGVRLLARAAGQAAAQPAPRASAASRRSCPPPGSSKTISGTTQPGLSDEQHPHRGDDVRRLDHLLGRDLRRLTKSVIGVSTNAGHSAVDLMPERAELAVHRLREADDAELRRRVDAQPRLALLAGDRRRVDDERVARARRRRRSASPAPRGRRAGSSAGSSSSWRSMRLVSSSPIGAPIPTPALFMSTSRRP